MIQHIVMLSLKDDASEAELASVMAGLAALGATLEGFEGFQHGPNHDFEQKTQDYPYGFICAFADKAALDIYANNPDHQALGGRLVAMCKGGGDGIMVMDIAVA